jgi:ABC-type oligopeptide transport system substrate-binding subunit
MIWQREINIPRDAIYARDQHREREMKQSSLRYGRAGLAIVAASGAAYADKANDTLRVAFTKELENVDSYFNSSREGVVLQRAIWDGLTYRDPITNEYKGNLATSWEWIDDLTLEFKLASRSMPMTWFTRSISSPKRKTASRRSAT